MNEKHAGVPVLLHKKTTATYCFSDLSLNENLCVLNVRALVCKKLCAVGDAQCKTDGYLNKIVVVV